MTAIDLSLTGTFHQATGVVQAVLIALGLCSVLGWAVILEKAARLLGLSRQARAFEAAVTGDGRSGLAPTKLVLAVREAAAAERAAVLPGESPGERRQRVEEAMRDAMHTEMLRAERRLSVLATIGSAAPFIGLFGTVWGIMHSFAMIAQANDTSLAVVAPGIAEALSTTAIGLAAAIPASIAFNTLTAGFAGLARRFSLAIARLARRLDGVGGEGHR